MSKNKTSSCPSFVFSFFAREHFSANCFFLQMLHLVFVVNITLVPKSPRSTNDLMWRSEKKECAHVPVCRGPLTAGPATHTHTLHRFLNCLLECIHLASFSSLHGAPQLMKPCDDGTIILLIGIALGAVWEQLGRSGCRCAHTHTYTHTNLRMSTHTLSLSHCCRFTQLLLHPCMYEPSSALCLLPSRWKHFYRTKRLQFSLYIHYSSPHHGPHSPPGECDIITHVGK